MELVNATYAFEAEAQGVPAAERAALLREAVETTLLLLGPMCPHITEELWSHLGHETSLFAESWPVAEPAALRKEEVTVVVQVDGKVRSRLTMAVGAPEAEVRAHALADEKVRPWIDGRHVERVVVVPRRLVNIVTRS